MANSSNSTYSAIAEIHTSVERTLQRCAGLPGLDTARLDRIAQLRAEDKALFDRATAHYGNIGRSTLVEAERIEQATQKTDLDLGAEQEAFERTVDETQRVDAEFQASRRKVRGDPAQLQELTQKHEYEAQQRAKEADARGSRMKELQARRKELRRELAIARAAGAERQAAVRDQPSPELEELLVGLRTLLDQVAAFERDVQGSSGEYVQRAVQADFTAHREAFTQAAAYHQTQAKYLLGALAVVVAGGATLTYFFATAPAQQSTLPQSHISSWLEPLLQHALGRLAALAILAISIRHLSQLHRANSQQLVIYRDRLAALGVIETIINIAPSDKKPEFLRTFSDRYLDFGRNAFEPISEAPLTTGVDVANKQLKETVSALQPALDVVRAVGSGK